PAVAHAPRPTAFVGQDIPIQLVATCRTGPTCAARLFYRTTPTSGVQVAGSTSWNRVDLDPGTSQSLNGVAAKEWHGVVPGSAVTTTGVDYFVEAEDNYATTDVPGTTYTLSSGSSIAYAYHVHTVSPPVVAHVPVAYGESGQALDVQVRATCFTPSCVATLYYRSTTDGVVAQPLLTVPAWSRITMSSSESVPLGAAGAFLVFDATLPGTSVDTRGLDYFIAVSDGATTSWMPGSSFEGYYAPT